MQRLIYVPPGGSIDLLSTCVEMSLTPPYIVGSISGTGATEHTVISSTIPGLDGAYIHGVRAESREISCYIHIKGNTRKEMYQNRFELIRKLTATDQPGMLYYYNDAVSGLSQILCKQRRVVENRANIFRAAAAKTVAALSTT